MRTLAKIAATLGVVGAIAVGGAAVDGVPGMGAHRVGPSKAAFVSRIIMVRGTGTDTATGTGTVNLEVASN